ncbi:cobalt-precorrin-6A reductase [Brucella pseudogrignonensis]|uniref:Precorrin-6A/cobalt-precorrin-6A reductase n=1 Tax=Brucella pseudogrignonensis TaxID=419475 RepID=A0ABU1M447_9HYPH|nr:cobalt-precorrin-6A reductase [Brucella pseudogrignonensis]MDR6430683.1 precorrin-6A/cobalt-precorrin-6A reductase [Brucella pseudogrignonensis]
MHVSKILILGGTAEAAKLASAFVPLPVESITSLAGRTANPTSISGKIRTGGFGGADGLATYLAHEKIDLLIDATHPYATRISQNAVQASEITNIPLLRLERPAWEKENGDNWIDVVSEAQAANLIPACERVLLALGRQHIAPFAERNDVHFFMRMIDPPEVSLPHDCEIVLAKPGNYDAEKQFLSGRKIGLIVSRNSGGSISYAKIKAARDLGIPVMMISRPQVSAKTIVATVDEAIEYARSVLRF